MDLELEGDLFPGAHVGVGVRQEESEVVQLGGASLVVLEKGGDQNRVTVGCGGQEQVLEEKEKSIIELDCDG